ncbi:MAG: endonuclease III [Candidatus Brocadiae bacterium]|nr:endonuclease III [Candidatus Brocadiia bacterium]
MARPAHKLTPRTKAVAVLGALAERYGEKERAAPSDPLAVLVRGVLSQNTSDVNSGRAYRSLMDRFGDWDSLAGATRGQIARAIKSAGLADQKAAAIRAILDWLGKQDGYSLDFLRGLDSPEVERRLRAIKGVGVKTARLVLLFGFGRPVFVVDTHVLRVSKRLGLIPPGCGRGKAHVLLDDLVPDSQKYSGHLNMIEHGRRTCHPRTPACDACPARQWCLHVRGQVQ